MRSHIVTIARTWLGTPYHHQASAKGAGTDCIGLVRGIWRELYGTEPQALPAYTRDWAEAMGRETLLEAARRHLVEVPPSEAQPGDILIFRWRRNAPAKHCAILAEPTTMIHALEGAPVSEVSLSPWWGRHLAGAFAFPGAMAPDAAQQRQSESRLTVPNCLYERR
jgi:NlpC/P60 family putative phage cell wall peptidase